MDTFSAFVAGGIGGLVGGSDCGCDEMDGMSLLLTAPFESNALCSIIAESLLKLKPFPFILYLC